MGILQAVPVKDEQCNTFQAVYLYIILYYAHL